MLDTHVALWAIAKTRRLPADVAQALRELLRLVTHDKALAAYSDTAIYI